MSSAQTPFNVGDEKRLKELVEKIENNFEIKPKEITADKVYGTTDNRAYLKDNEITASIAFYKEPIKEVKKFGIRDFEISNDVNSVKCPNGIISTNFKVASQKDKEFRVFKFDRNRNTAASALVVLARGFIFSPEPTTNSSLKNSEMLSRA